MSIHGWASVLKKNQLLYPDERIVTFIASNYRELANNEGKKALDIGFSSGRHLALLNDYHFEAYGIDFNPAAIDTAVSIFGETLRPRLQVGDIKDKPYPDAFFDLVLFYGVAFLRTKALMLHDLKQVHQMMKPGAKMILNFRTKENWFYGKGCSNDGNFFCLDETAGPYAGLEYTFLDQEEAEQLLQQAGFTITNTERLDLHRRSLTEHHSWWIFWVEKP